GPVRGGERRRVVDLDKSNARAAKGPGPFVEGPGPSVVREDQLGLRAAGAEELEGGEEQVDALARLADRGGREDRGNGGAVALVGREGRQVDAGVDHARVDAEPAGEALARRLAEGDGRAGAGDRAAEDLDPAAPVGEPLPVWDPHERVH